MGTDGEAPKTLWLSAIFRARFELEVEARPDRHGSLFAQDDYILGLAREAKRLKNHLYIQYAITFAGAILVLSGSSGNDQNLEAFGVSIPIGLFSTQAIAAATASVFATYITTLISLTMLNIGISKILEIYGPTCWEYYVAKEDATFLYGALIRPKFVGYVSPRREVFVILLVGLVAMATGGLHAAVVFLAGFRALSVALSTGDWIAILLGGFSVVAVVVSFVGYLAALFIPLPYRLRETEIT